MSKKSIQKKYHELAAKVIENFVFFIPNRVFDELSKDSENLKLFKPHINTIFILDRMRGPINYKDIKDSNEFQYSYSLINNKYKLLELRKKLDTLEFDLVFKDYCKQVVFYKFLANLFIQEFDYNVEEIKDETSFSKLTNQQRELNDHLKNLKTIGSFNENVSSNELFKLDTQLADFFIDQKDHIAIDIPDNETISTPKLFFPKKKKPKKEKVQIDEAAIRRYLLETQFNVDFSKINNC